MAAHLGTAYGTAALTRIHELIVRGYQQMREQDLHNASEEHITGLLVESMRHVLESPSAPLWAWQFSVHEERPVTIGQQTGRARPRIDFVLELVTRRPRPRFPFEAKRLYRSDSVAEYIGQEGLGCFISGIYPAPEGVAGMLGYVQVDTSAEWVVRIEKKLTQERLQCRLDVSVTSGLVSSPVYTGLEQTYRSQHVTEKGHLHIYHSFLLFLPASA